MLLFYPISLALLLLATAATTGRPVCRWSAISPHKERVSSCGVCMYGDMFSCNELVYKSCTCTSTNCIMLALHVHVIVHVHTMILYCV